MDEKLRIIIEGAEKVFYKYGIRSVSMDDVCKDLGISKKTLYQFVRNKEDLITRIVDWNIEKHKIRVENFIQKGLNAIDKLFEISKIISSRIKEINPSYNFDLNKYYPELFNKQVVYRNKLISNRIKENIKHGIKDGLYREDLDIDLIAQLYIQKLEFINDPECYSGKKVSFSRIFNVMFENHIRGISNQKGIDYLEKKKKSLNFKI